MLSARVYKWMTVLCSLWDAHDPSADPSPCPSLSSPSITPHLLSVALAGREREHVAPLIETESPGEDGPLERPPLAELGLDVQVLVLHPGTQVPHLTEGRGRTFRFSSEREDMVFPSNPPQGPRPTDIHDPLRPSGSASKRGLEAARMCVCVRMSN